MIDGRTASAPNRTYPVLAEPATIVAGQANAVPYVFYLPPIDVENEKIIVPGQANVVTTPRVPGLQLTVPANANLRNRDNTPVTRVSITPVPIDRTPTPLPPNVTTAMVYTNQPGGAISDVPMPMVFPNLQGADPGTRAELYAFNHDTVQWYVYGYGRVSADGRLIVPEIDPATGQPYGLVDFSWYFPSVTPDGNPGEPCPCPSNRTGGPVDLSTGTKIETMTDVSFSGARGGIEVTRVFTSDLNAYFPPFTQPVIGRFGRGTKDSYDIRLSGSFGLGGAGRVIFPEERSGRLFSYTRTDSDGALVFTATSFISQLKNELRQLPNGTFEFRFEKGQLLRFDASRRLTAMVDRNGNTTTLTYTGGKLTTVTDGVGRSITLEYNGASLVSRMTDQAGRRWLYTYEFAAPDTNQLVSVTDPLDNVVRYHYDEGPLVSITDGRGHIFKSLEYNVDGRVSRQTFADGGFETYSYQRSGTYISAATLTASSGKHESKRFNWAGYVLGTTDSLGQSSTITRDISTNQKLSTAGSCGCVNATDEYDARGNLIASTDRLGQTAHWEYEPVFNNVTRAIDRLNRETTFGYDSRGNLTSVTNALNETITLTYDSFGQLTSIKDGLNHTTTMEYDSAGNLTAVVDALNHRTTMEYDALGRLTAVTDALNRRRSQTYDALNRILTTTDPANAITHYTYDANGNLTSYTNHLQKRWQWDFDEKNRPTKQTDPLNRSTEYKYNANDQVVEIKSPLNRIVKYAYDARGQLASITDPLNQVVRFEYDHRGNPTNLIDPRGYTTTYSYDELGRPTGRRNPLGQFTDVTYNAVGRVTSSTDEQGRRTSINYDPLHRTSQVVYPDASVSYTYDAAGRTTRIDDSQGGAIQWAYDDANRLLSETTAAGVVTYGYNAANQRTSMNASGAAPVSYGYDTAGRLNTITKASDTFTLAYDALSRLSSLQLPNGVTTNFNYDVVNRLTQLKYTNGLNQSIEDFRYTYTLDNQISSITSLNPAQTLPAAKSANTADAANRVTQFGPANYSFDSLGQTTSKTDAQGTTNYQWDSRGRLTGATVPTGQTVTYAYDALGRRTSRTTNGVTTQFLYDGGEVVRDSSTDNSSVDYVNGPAIDQKLQQSSSTTGTQYFLQDHLGSVRALTNSSGGVVEQRQYEPFGAASDSSLSRYGHSGRESDEVTGLTYNRARWYDSQQGRFLSEDPIGIAGGLNLYSYVANNPISFNDPMGLSRESFLNGFWNTFAVSFAVSAVISAAIALTGGTAAAVIGMLVALYGGYQLLVAIQDLMASNLCTDEFDERLGELVGSVLGGILGGYAGGAAGSGLRQIPRVRRFMDDEGGWMKLHDHHSDPKMYGGDPNQPLTTLPEDVHQNLHTDMADFMEQYVNSKGQSMRPGRGNSGDQIQAGFTRDELLWALRDFYKEYGDIYPEAACDFFRQHPGLR
jgi:RHS repeat-associated protein